MSDQNYDANEMQHLEGLDAVRKRPGMYISTTDSRGLTHLAYEIIDNAVDEAVAGHCTHITVTLHHDESIEVEDNGRGIPTAIHTKTGIPAALAVFTLLHFGGKFGSGNYKTGTSGLHGVGSSVCAALSTKLEATIKRDGHIHKLQLKTGKLGTFAGENPTSTFTPQKTPTLQNLGKMKPTDHTGTTVRFWPDKTIFLPEAKMDTHAIRRRLRQTAFLVPGLTLTYHDNYTNPTNPKTETYKYDGGIVDMVNLISHDTKICDTIHIQGQGTFKETVPMLNTNGDMEPTEMERTVDVNIALRWGNGYDTHINTFVNIVATPNGGTHLKGFDRALVQTLRKAYDGTRLLKTNDEPPILEDFQEGLTAVISIGVPEPQFVGQTKEELGTAGVTKIVQDTVTHGLNQWLTGKKKNQTRAVLEKIANAAKTRVAHRTQKEANRRKTALETASMPTKLVDCRANGVPGSELILVEGDSALGCGFWDTVLKTVGAKDLSFKELADDWDKGITHFGYATDENGDVVVVPLVEPRLTKRDAEVVEVELDNGEILKFTPDHLFRLRDGSYRQAEDLQVGDSLMPLYMRLSDNSKTGKEKLKRYQMVWHNGAQQWAYVHHLADEYNLNVGYYGETPEGYVRHHIDFNKYNNDPRNLRRMTHNDHFVLHGKYREENLERIEAGYRRWLDEEGGRDKQSAQLTMQWQDPEFREMCVQRLQERNDDPVWRAFFVQSFQDWYHGLSDEDKVVYAEDMRRRQEEYWCVPEHRAEQSVRVRQYFEDHPEHRERHRELGKAVWDDDELRRWRSGKTVEQFADPGERERQSRAVKAWVEGNPEWLEWKSGRMREWWAENGEVQRERVCEGIRAYVDGVPREVRVKCQNEGRKLAALKRIASFGGVEGLGGMDEGTLRRVYEEDRLAHHVTAYKFDRLVGEFFGGDVEALKDAAVRVNHSVVAVRRLGERGDVYDVSVPGYHNFALAGGVFVHNSARQGRNSEFQALLPLRGKILNVQKATLSQMLKNNECASIIQVVGAGSGRTFDISQMRYERLILMTDADTDGSHIRTLLIVLIYRYMRPIIEQGRLYSAVPPLYKVESTGRGKEVQYVYEQKDLEKTLAGFKRARRTVKYPIQRYKGLGEMDAEELWETTMDPETRTIRRITMGDAEEAEDMLELLMGEDVAVRREYLVESFAQLSQGV